MAEACLVPASRSYRLIILLDEYEANAFKAMMQNPIGENELPVGAKLRRVIFEAISKEAM